MKCENVSNDLISYLDMRMDSAERREMEEHLAGCAACRTRAEEFRGVRNMLGELPAIEPSFGFIATIAPPSAYGSAAALASWIPTRSAFSAARWRPTSSVSWSDSPA